MADEHPTRDEIEKFLEARLEPAATGRVVRHLLGRCERCRERLAELRSGGRPPRPEDPTGLYDPVFDRAQDELRRREVELAHERIVAPGLVAALGELTADGQLRRIRSAPRYQTWGLCERLIHECRDRIFGGSPELAIRSVRLAVAVADALDPARYSVALVFDLRARARGELANALRTGTDFAGAREAFAEARRLLESGSGDPFEAARLTSLEVSLLYDLGGWAEASAALDRVLKLYRRPGNEALLARALVQKGILLGAFDPPAAASLLAEAEGLIDRVHEPRLFLCARHNRIFFLGDSGERGDCERALMLLQDSRALYRQFPDEWSQLRMRWLEARLAFGLGHLDEAESALSLLWSFVFERRLHLELALLTLDLTAVYVARGEMKKAWQTAGRLVPLFRAWGVHRHAMAAWLLLQRAFAAETATSELIREVGRYLARSWKNPELPFEPHHD
jgi:tetratricopeptide (TPR) repeat protein